MRETLDGNQRVKVPSWLFARTCGLAPALANLLSIRGLLAHICILGGVTADGIKKEGPVPQTQLWDLFRVLQQLCILGTDVTVCVSCQTSWDCCQMKPTGATASKPRRVHSHFYTSISTHERTSENCFRSGGKAPQS